MDCPRCTSADTRTYGHRAPGDDRKNPLLCFNGRPKAAHICVAECAKPGLFCRRCRVLSPLPANGKETQQS